MQTYPPRHHLDLYIVELVKALQSFVRLGLRPEEQSIKLKSLSNEMAVAMWLPHPTTTYVFSLKYKLSGNGCLVSNHLGADKALKSVGESKNCIDA